MRLPDDPRKFYRVATQRFEDTRFLFEGGRHALSIYVAGYAVECGLKALILSTVPKNRQGELAASFRGPGGHHLGRPVESYGERKGPRPSLDVTKGLAYAGDEWSVALRYLAGERPYREAERFLRATDRILDWAKGRL